VREAVAVRRVEHRGQTLVYLSLFDDELDPRLEEFLMFTPGEGWSEANLAGAALCLEPTDAVIIAGRDEDILVARGGACNFPLYWKVIAGSTVVTTALPIDGERRLSIAGLIDSVAVVSVTYQNEPNLSRHAPLNGWFRCRRGTVSRFSASAGCLSERPIDLADSAEDKHGRDQLIGAIRLALDKFGRRQQGRPRALVELSGGIDSTLAAIAVRSHGVELHGISIHFPYYEFRFEDNIQLAVAKSLGVVRTRRDGSSVFPYAPPDWWPRLDEPATCIIAIKRDLMMARLASGEGIDRVLVGQGGDQVFSEDMLQPVPGPMPLARGAFSAAGWGRVESARALMERFPRYLRRSTLTYLHDARLDVAFKEYVGAITRSPFCDIDMARCGMFWARLSARDGVIEGKRILAEAFAKELPGVVTGRRAKVSWDGICARSYAQHADSIIDEIERVSAPLEHIGLNARWLVRRVRELARWEKTTFGQDDKEVFAAYALATWLHSWGVERVRDCGWGD